MLALVGDIFTFNIFWYTQPSIDTAVSFIALPAARDKQERMANNCTASLRVQS